jgi:hypothetical protein
LTSGRLLLGLAVIAGVLASSAAASSFPMQVSVTGSQPEPTACPASAAAEANCTRLQGKGRARGLGAYEASAVVVRTPRASGGFDSTVTGSLSTSRGALSFTGDNRGDPAGKLTYAIAVSGSAGYASVTGTGALVYSGIIAGNGTFLVNASLDPATAFDLSAPTLTLGGVVARSLGRGRYAVAVHYKAADANSDPLDFRLTSPGMKTPLASGAASGPARATVKVGPKTHRIVLRLTVEDASANSTTRSVSVALP